MKRQAIRGLLLFGLLVVVVTSTGRAQNIPDKVTVRGKDGASKSYDGTLTLTPAGFQVISADKKVLVTAAPDDILKVAIGDLPGLDRNVILNATTKEGNKEYDAARAIYQDQLKKSGIPDRTKRYLEFKKLQMTNKIVDELSADKGWKEQAEKCVGDWNSFLIAEDTKSGWEQWPATRACTRLQIELGKYEDASRAWSRVNKNKNMPADAKLEAAIQEIDLQIRSKQYSTAVTAATDLLKSAVGARKDRLAIYEIAAKAGADGKPLDGIDKIKAEMNKTKDTSVHTTGFSVMGELYLAGGKPRDAMWMFLWVETVLNQDKDEAFKAVSRLAEIFKSQMEEELANKYREKLKQFRALF